MLTVRIRNLLLLWRDPVVEARLYIDPIGGPYRLPDPYSISFDTTDAHGVCKLDIDYLQPGEHRLWIVPQHSSLDPVGPRTATGPDVKRIFCPMCIQFETGMEKFVKRAWIHSSTINNGELNSVPLGKIHAQELDVRLKPMWMKSPFHSDRGKQRIDMIVVHKTGDAVIGPAINQFLNGGTSAHYIVDRDGHVLKMVLDSRAAGHASNENGNNQSHWGTQTRLAWRSIGIENVGTVKQGFTDVQYKSLIRLMHELMYAHYIRRHRVIGHSDILTDGHRHLSDMRIACPGDQFDWSQLENAMPPIGLVRRGGGYGNFNGHDPVGDFFNYMNNGMTLVGAKAMVLRPGDFDPQTANGKPKPAKLGGVVRSDVTQTPIKHLQTWLSEIGYSVGPVDGVFNSRTARAVKHFQVHFEGRSNNDTVNAQTAALIRSVRNSNPKAE